MLSFVIVSTLVTAVISSIHAVVLPRVPGLNIDVGNDDGWAEANMRALFASLEEAGHNVVLSAPTQNESGTGSLDVAPLLPITLVEGQYNTIPVGSPSEGSNSTDLRLNYVDSFPVSAIKYGIETVALKFFDTASVDTVVSGPNVGTNLGIDTVVSGMVGAAAEAIKEGIPAIAFSGANSEQRSYTTLAPGDYSFLYATVAINVVHALTATGKPYLPAGVGLNINFPNSNATTCTDPNAFRYILSRIYTNPFARDVTTCGSTRLPNESDVVASPGCVVSISVFNADDKLDSSAEVQGTVLTKSGAASHFILGHYLRSGGSLHTVFL